MAAECTLTEREFGRCSRPTVRPGRTVHDEGDHGESLLQPPARRRGKPRRVAGGTGGRWWGALG